METVLRFTPYAYAKLLYMRDAGDTEISGFAKTTISDPLLVVDFCLLKQECTSTSIKLDADAQAEYLESCAEEFFTAHPDKDDNLDTYFRIWIHTHPGSSAYPSMTDEDTFNKTFKNTDWSVMFIIAKGGETTCRMKTNRPNIVVDLSVRIECGIQFNGSDWASWKKEYDRCVTKKVYVPVPKSTNVGKHGKQGKPKQSWQQWNPNGEDEYDMGGDNFHFRGDEWEWLDDSVGNEIKYLIEQKKKMERDLQYAILTNNKEEQEDLMDEIEEIETMILEEQGEQRVNAIIDI